MSVLMGNKIDFFLNMEFSLFYVQIPQTHFQEFLA